MSDNPFHPPSEPKPASGAAQPPAGPGRRLAEHVAIGAIVLAALAVPLLTGLAYYLVLNDALVVNGDNPTHEARLWMIQERRGPTGLAWSIASPLEQPAQAPDRCAQIRVGFLKWDDGLRLEPPVRYCQCYERVDGQWNARQIDCP